jgi:flavorubredoxin
MLIDHLHIDDARFQVVADGETLSLGDKTLTFVFTPWVHWPETMSTWLAEDKILFSCDFFGSHWRPATCSPTSTRSTTAPSATTPRS